MAFDRTKEQLKFYTELIKILSIVFLALGSGSLTLILTAGDRPRNFLLAFFGFISTITVLVITIRLIISSFKLLNTISDE
jgi:hypothetical protein